MRKLLMIVFVCITTLAQAQLTSKEEVAPELAAKREAQKEEITSNYLALKNNLIASDSLAVITNATALQNSLKNFRFKKLSLEQMNEAAKTRKEIIALAAEVTTTKNINKQRRIFQSLSVKFWELAPKFKATDTELHLQMCPMTSAEWVSDSKEIKNPYYPKNMLTCGVVKASL
ncbi:DUF3347 domain-containing protein [Flavobacterium sp. JLP]|uniref:DUF3347 domain-containing protein n=1 Tax=Flavobacterium sp. JLP TaxID=2783793 RepID=UPI00188D7231|nr:DUF3347 domain-containing protein [Flavobacterium sp. JLP]MBF4505324.1 DUF3347 domain-containing protein [Flavobacterium sp. JLP]